jgi:vacuolar-type H+-ATPase subunit H
MDKSLATVVFIAVAAETPNKLLLKARQEAYELVTQQAKDLLDKQRKSYEDQCAGMAEEHQKCTERMKRESDKMLEEATKVQTLINSFSESTNHRESYKMGYNFRESVMKWGTPCYKMG